MEILKFNQIKKNLEDAARYNRNTDCFFEVEVHKKLLDICHFERYYYYIFNCLTAEIEYVSELAKQVLGLDVPAQLTTAYLVNNMHPDDAPYFYAFEQKVISFLKQLGPEKAKKYKMSYDYRVKNGQGKYIRILQQSTTIQSDTNGSVIRALGVHADISHLKKNGKPTLSFIGLEDQPSYYDIPSEGTTIEPQREVLTRRENEVLAMVVKGLTSKQIADKLFISKTTVEGHRKHILKKTDCKSTVELAMKMV